MAELAKPVLEQQERQIVVVHAEIAAQVGIVGLEQGIVNGPDIKANGRMDLHHEEPLEAQGKDENERCRAGSPGNKEFFQKVAKSGEVASRERKEDNPRQHPQGHGVGIFRLQ